MTRKCNNHRRQTNLQCREEETQNTDSHNRIKVNQPALSSVRCLLNLLERTPRITPQNRNQHTKTKTTYNRKTLNKSKFIYHMMSCLGVI